VKAGGLERGMIWRVEAAGNRFLLLDAVEGERVTERDAARLARESCGESSWPAHGLLVMEAGTGARASVGGSLAMTVYNADGGLAEACGNGLRCAGAWAVARGGGPGSRISAGRSGNAGGPGNAASPGNAGSPVRQAGGTHLEIETVAGGRWVEVAGNGDRYRVRAGLGPVMWRGPGFRVKLDGADHMVECLDLANPHAVVFVDSLDGLPLERWAAEVRGQGSFPCGVNVEFAALGSRPEEGPTGDLCVRVHERGVGETGSCGTGACAVAWVAAERLGLSLPLDLAFPGGVLRVGLEAGEAWVEGPVNLRAGPVQNGPGPKVAPKPAGASDGERGVVRGAGRGQDRGAGASRVKARGDRKAAPWAT
jgi:diaminopimelate epimerase